MTRLTERSPAGESKPRAIARVALGSMLVFAGVSHLTFARQDFQTQVPDFVPLSPDVTVVASGVVEILLGTATIALKSRRAAVGIVLAAFFVAVFPGNIAQYVHHRDAFGLDTDQARATRLIFQPVLIAWALWSTGAWSALRKR
ncbi:UNVERIFIED_CONTAM: putative membrane protein [Williamsia faeni]